ncbi:MAG: hypothetical protein COT17_02300 [Elusimicrobia bacterium CG08_land_8_20_14_0_20_51_18]|nr:MAG: hypothetical protein COT17_02300 [Elusimicrobia bacterium CG08_land_8_20_14_0_20_51_18]
MATVIGMLLFMAAAFMARLAPSRDPTSTTLFSETVLEESQMRAPSMSLIILLYSLSKPSMLKDL